MSARLYTGRSDARRPVAPCNGCKQPEWEGQMEVVRELLSSLHANETPKIFAMNKADRLPGACGGQDTVYISAKTGEGLRTLLSLCRGKLARSL